MERKANNVDELKTGTVKAFETTEKAIEVKSTLYKFKLFWIS